MFWHKKETNTKTKGDIGEEVAAKYLDKKGYKILEFHFQNPKGRRLGEIDIVAEKDKALVFVEVKTRIGNRYLETLPEENITPDKLYKLSKIAQFYIRSKNLWNRNYHFDAVSVWLSDNEKCAKIKHIENIFI